MIDAARWERIDALFAAVLDLPAGEREAFLDAECAEDSDLRRRVERLLEVDGWSGGFLEGQAGELLGLAAESDEGERLGPYRLLRRIGDGGMGTVYLARREDDQYQQEVAVKILRSGLADTGLRHRFLAERQILARLEHPNIARLYDGGSTEEGRPYLVMELIAGIPVDEYCDRHRLTVDQRLHLFRRICAAVQYAHQNLLVHRDLKPGNILITAEGEPKLLDFGIAKQLAEKAAGDPQRTRTGLRMLTPSYASPEQVTGGAITTASDVYSLGVILYELLAGRSPYKTVGDASYEIERAICEEEPERPSAAMARHGAPSPEDIAAARNSRSSALRRRLQGDLDNVILAALRKEPRRRYGSVSQLARDLEMHLQDLPVTARPDTLPYRARKFLRRHRTAAAAAAAAVLLAAAFMASLITQGRRIEEERDKARYALSFLVDIFKQADPYQTQGKRLTAREILARGAARSSRELADQPDVQAAVMDAVGEADRGLGLYADAEPLLEKALALRRRLARPDALEIAESLEHLAALKSDRSDLAAAEALLREALAIRRRRLGEADLEVARTLNVLGDLLVTKGAPAAEVERIQRQALGLAREVETPPGAAVARSVLFLAKARLAAGEYAEAERLFREGLALERRALRRGDPRLYRDQTAFAESLLGTAKFNEAAALLRHTLEAQRRLLGAEHPDVASTLANLAEAVYEQGQYAEAEVLNRQALTLVRSHYGPDHWTVPLILSNLAVALQSQKKVAEAVPYLEETLAVRRRSLGEAHPLVAQALLLLAGAHRQLAEYPQALRLAQESLAILEKAEGPDHPHLAYPVREIGRIYMAQQRYGEAEPFLRRSLEIRRKELPAGHPEIARAKGSLGSCLAALGRDGEAVVLLREANATFAAKGFSLDESAQQARALLAKLERRR